MSEPIQPRAGERFDHYLERRASERASAARRRCRWPLGWSENLSVTCALEKGHDGPHRSSFETLTGEATA